MNNFRRMLSARRDAVMANEDKGFTLIELIVVIVIIGILAAIAIPVFLGQQASANAAAAEANVANAKIALTSYIADEGLESTAVVDAIAVADLVPFGWPQGSDAAIFAGSTVADFCIDSEVSGQTRSVTATSGTIAETACS